MACGSSVELAEHDDETTTTTFRGTSVSAPQVAGAAAQLRARFPSLTALETRAILLTSASDLQQANPSEDRNGFGLGMLRNDRAHEVAVSGSFSTGQVTLSSPYLIPLQVTQGETYSIGAVWDRIDTLFGTWSDLDLLVEDATGRVVISGTEPRNANEFVRFQSPLTGTLTIKLVANTLVGTTVQPVAVAVSDAPGATIAGTLDTFGNGCPGTGLESASSVNERGGSLQHIVRAREIAYGFDLQQAELVTGFDLWTTSTTGTTETVAASVYELNPTSGLPRWVPLATTTLSVGPREEFHRALFASPVALPPGQYFLGVDHTATTVELSSLQAGEAGLVYFRTTVGTGRWSRSPVNFPALRLLRDGAAAPQHHAAGAPAIGQTLTLRLSYGAAGSLAFLTLGLSNTSWSGIPLPLALDSIGAQGCALLVSQDITLTIPTSQAGESTLAIPIPNEISLLDLRLFTQCAVFDPPANALGLAFSNGLSTRLGSR